MRKKFKGFSTSNGTKPPFTITDIECIKTDIMNEFNTIRGERVMMPEYGSIIQTIIHDPLDQVSKDMVKGDVVRIIGNDPRVRQSGTPRVVEYDTTVRIDVELIFLGQVTPDTLSINFSRDLRG